MLHLSATATPEIAAAIVLAGAIGVSIATGKSFWLFSAFMGPSNGRRLVRRVDDPFYYWLTIGMLALFLITTLLLLASHGTSYPRR